MKKKVVNKNKNIIIKLNIHFIYASECKTRCGLGGTVMNNGSAGDSFITKFYNWNG